MMRDQSTEELRLRKLDEGRRRKQKTPLAQVRFMQRTIVQKVDKEKLSGVALSSLVKSWSLLEGHRLTLLGVKPSRVNAQQADEVSQEETTPGPIATEEPPTDGKESL